MTERDDERSRPDAVSHGAAQFGAAAAANAARAADRLESCWAAVEKMISNEQEKLNGTNPTHANWHYKLGRGHVFEALNDMKDNIKLAGLGKNGKWINARLNPRHEAVRSVLPPGYGANRIAQDSVFVVDGKVVQGRQDKLLDFRGKYRSQNFRSLSDEKFSKEILCVASDDIEVVRAGLLERATKAQDPHVKQQYLDAAGRLHPGVSNADVDRAIKDPAGFIFRQELKAFGKEASFASASAALAAGVVSGAMSSIRNGIRLYNGEISGAQATRHVGADAAVSVVRAGGQAALSVAIRTGAVKAGMVGLANGAAASTMAGAVIEVGRVVYNLAVGKTSPEKAMESLGEAGCVTVAGLYAGGAAAAVFGKAGVVQLTVAGVVAPLSLPVLVASTASCIAVAAMYQACLQIFKTARLEKEQAERVMALAAAAEEELRLQRVAFEQAAEAYLQDQQEVFDSAFAAISDGFAIGDLETTMLGLAQLATTVGAHLRFQSFDEFEQFMEDPETVLVI